MIIILHVPLMLLALPVPQQGVGTLGGGVMGWYSLLVTDYRLPVALKLISDYLFGLAQRTTKTMHICL